MVSTALRASPPRLCSGPASPSLCAGPSHRPAPHRPAPLAARPLPVFLQLSALMSPSSEALLIPRPSQPALLPLDQASPPRGPRSGGATNISTKGRVVNILGFAGHTVSVAASPPEYESSRSQRRCPDQVLTSLTSDPPRILKSAEGRESYGALERYCTCKRYISKSIAGSSRIAATSAMKRAERSPSTTR